MVKFINLHNFNTLPILLDMIYVGIGYISQELAVKVLRFLTSSVIRGSTAFSELFPCSVIDKLFQAYKKDVRASPMVMLKQM